MGSLATALATALALLMAAGPVPSVEAMDQWCEDDPPVTITTPGGRLVVVYVTSGALGVEHLPAVQLAAISYTVQSVNGGQATRVDMTVTVSNDAFGGGFPTRTTASSGPFATGTIYDATSGVSGQPMTLRFTLPVP